MRVLAQPRPLPRERELLLLHAIDDLCEIPTHAVHRLRVAVSMLGGPHPPRRTVTRATQRFERSIVVEPAARCIEERVILTALGRRDFVVIEKSSVAGGIRSHPIRGSIRAGRAERQ